MVRDAAHVYAVAGNKDGLACCRAFGKLLCDHAANIKATPEMLNNLKALMTFDIEFTQTRLKEVARN